MAFRDRQLFRKIRLANDLKVYCQRLSIPMVRGAITVPVGTANSTGRFLPGTAHFFEHLLFRRSEMFPKPNSLWPFLARQKAQANGGTGDVTTTFWVEAPPKTFLAAWQALQAIVFAPLFKTEDIAAESPVILAERGLYTPYFPGNSPTSHFLRTGWADDEPFDLRQIFGDPADHEALTPEQLQDMHHSGYLSRDCTVVIAGNLRPADETQILKELEGLQLELTHLPRKVKPFYWRQRDFPQQTLPDIGQPSYLVGGYLPFANGRRPDYAQGFALQFLLNYLWNSLHGPLFDWLRWQKGWIYDTHWGMDQDWRGLSWFMLIPLNNEKFIMPVRGELWHQVETALADRRRLRVEVDRVLAGQPIAFETLDAIVEKAIKDLEIFGQINSQLTAREQYVRCRNPIYLESVYRSLLRDSNNVGEALLLPMA